MRKVGDLTPRQAAFVREYLVDLNATQAAIRAGYAPGSADVAGARLLGNAKIGRAIADAMQKRAEKVELTAELVVAGLITEAQRTGPGSSHAARVSALGLLGKHLGMFAERVEHSGPNGGPVRFADMTDTDLMRHARQLTNRLAALEAAREAGPHPATLPAGAGGNGARPRTNGNRYR